MAMQRIANPSISVRLRVPPPILLIVFLLLRTPVFWRQAVQSLVPSCPGGETGRHKGLKIPRLNGRAGSIPAPGTIYYPLLHSN